VLFVVEGSGTILPCTGSQIWLSSNLPPPGNVAQASQLPSLGFPVNHSLTLNGGLTGLGSPVMGLNSTGGTFVELTPKDT